MERLPITFQFQDNESCNLACPSRRARHIIRPRRHPYSVAPVVTEMAGIQTVAMSLAGDPFANPEHREFLQQEGSPPDVILWTNGLLFPRYSPTIRRNVTVVLMSVDADTYERLRWPGK